MQTEIRSGRDAALEEAAKMVEWIGDNEGCEEIAEMMAAAIRSLTGHK